jgi:hypothetical protein
MKKILLFLMLVAMMGFVSASVFQANTIAREPVNQDVTARDNVSVDAVIPDLGDYRPPSVGNYSIDLGYDFPILGLDYIELFDKGENLDGWMFGSMRMPGEPVSYHSGVNVFELSRENPWDLMALQAGSFNLFRLNLNALTPGTSPSNLNGHDPSHAWRNPPVADLHPGNPTVHAVHNIPEAATLLLLSSGLAIIGFFRRSKRY